MICFRKWLIMMSHWMTEKYSNKKGFKKIKIKTSGNLFLFFNQCKSTALITLSNSSSQKWLDKYIRNWVFMGCNFSR